MRPPLSLLRRVLDRAQQHDPRNSWFGIGRSLIAFAHLITLALTAPGALLAPVLGEAQAPHCDSLNVISAYCIGPSSIGQEWRRWIMVGLLAVICSGFRPRWTVVPHFWIAFSIGNSIALPDGGDSVAKIVCLLLIPIGLADDRVWHWVRPHREIAPTLRTLSFVFVIGIRAQLAGLYLDSAITKLGVPDWVNGSAEYYIVRDHLFGVAAPLSGMVNAITRISFVTAGMSWGAIAIEIVIAVCLLSTRRWRKVGLELDLALHAMIIITMGLWSFALIMIGSCFIAAMPDRRQTVAPAPTDQMSEADMSEADLAVDRMPVREPAAVSR